MCDATNNAGQRDASRAIRAAERKAAWKAYLANCQAGFLGEVDFHVWLDKHYPPPPPLLLPLPLLLPRVVIDPHTLSVRWRVDNGRGRFLQTSVDGSDWRAPDLQQWWITPSRARLWLDLVERPTQEEPIPD